MNPIIRTIAVTGLLWLSSQATAATDKVSSYTLDIEFQPQQSSLQGQADITFTGPLEKGNHVFYLHGELEVESLSINGKAVDFETESVFYGSSYALVADKVIFELAEAVADAELTVAYRGYFHPSSARSPSDYMRIDEDGVFLRAWGYSLWFPVFLDDGEDVHRVDFPSVRFKVPATYELVFIGDKTSEQRTPRYATTTWRADDALLWDPQVTARAFRRLEAGIVTIYHLDSDESHRAAGSVAAFTQSLLAYYREHYRLDAGVDRLYLLEMPRYGDISSHNMVGVSSDTFRSFDTAVYAKRTIAHELVHPFVSVQTDRSDALWSLAIEGFPSFFHLPALRQMLGGSFYDQFMLKVQDYYLNNKGVEKDRWGNTRPPERPLMEISADQMSRYKDDYILWGRTKLFFNYLLRQMGEEAFSNFASDLFARTELTETGFVALCKQYLPGKAAQIDTWLYSNDFPDGFRIRKTE